MRKGFFYTVTVLVFLVALLIIFLIMNSRSSLEQHQSVTSRIRSSNAFLMQLEDDSRRAALIAGVHTLIALEQHIVDTGTFLVTPENDFREIFLTGSLNNKSFEIMQNSTFTEYLSRVQDIADRTGVRVELDVVNVSIRQNDPWNILVEYLLEENVTDRAGVASWNAQTMFNVRIPITDIKDPIFSVYTVSRVPHTIKRTNVTQFVDDTADANDTTGLQQYLNDSGYIASPFAPNFLMRLTGNLSASPHGIESFVDVVEIDNQGLPVTLTRSAVDYLYFGTEVSDDACNFDNMPNTFKLDYEHLDMYQINGTLNYTVCV